MDATAAGYVFLAMNVAEMAQRTIRTADELQQRHAWLAVPVAVWKKFGDDQAGNLAALIAYSGLVAIFPLLLVLVTVLDIVLKDNPGLKQTVLNAVDKYPAISLIEGHVDRLNQAGIALLVGLVGTFIGPGGGELAAKRPQLGVGDSLRPPPRVPVVVAAQHHLDRRRRHGLHRHHGPVRARGRCWPRPARRRLSVLALVVSLVLNFGLFWLAFRLATAKDITWRQLWLGAAISAVIWQILQAFGGYFLSHQIAHASPLYGTFAVVLGLIAWLYLQAELTLYAVEINVVRAYRLWPRSLAPPPYTEQDRHAFRLYVEKRGNQMDIAEAGGEDNREKTPG